MYLILAPISTAECQTRSRAHTVKVSAYTNCVKETGSKNGKTASGLLLKKQHCKRVIALSRELAKQYKYGDKFWLCYDNNICLDVVFEDTMSRRVGKNKVDLLVLSRMEAFKFGVKRAKLIKKGIKS